MNMSRVTFLRQSPRRMGGVRFQTTGPKRQHPLSRPIPSNSRKEAQKWSTGTLISLTGFVGGALYMYGTYDGAKRAREEEAKKLKTFGGSEVNVTEEQWEDAMVELRDLLPPECLSEDKEILESKAGSSWSYHPVLETPGAVIYPRSTSDVLSIVQLANKYSIPLVPYSGGTSLEGHFNAPSSSPTSPSHEKAGHGKGHHESPFAQKQGEWKRGRSWTLSFSEYMDRILEVHEGDLDVVVQPGVGYEDLNEHLKAYKLLFPVDPGPGALIGGMISTGCSGTNAVRYGTMRENVLNLTVVTADGQIVKTRQRAKKSSAGPDLGRLFIGAEGTLGIITEATLKLAPLLPTSVGVCSFNTFEEAAATVTDLIQHGVGVQCLELLDDVMMQAVNKSGGTGRTWDERPSLFIKFAGTDQQIKNDVAQTSKIVSTHGGSKFIFARSEKEKEDIWAARKVALYSAIDFVPGCRIWTTDVCVPISKLPTLAKETKEDITASGLVGPIVGHAGDGNFHALLAFRNEEEFRKAEGVVDRMVKRAQRLEGTCTGEHGVGIGKRDYLEAELGSETINLMRKIKRLLDPKNIMNPGKLIPQDSE
ncbi:hypothetical protein BT69DRAFT_1313989 [Atractiella rhizophila]|nr:hypothetical protein BT69DRAFT_1313989 [Atractiella rhizophila]